MGGNPMHAGPPLAIKFIRFLPLFEVHSTPNKAFPSLRFVSTDTLWPLHGQHMSHIACQGGDAGWLLLFLRERMLCVQPVSRWN